MRKKILFDKNWDFHKGDIKLPQSLDKGPIYIQAKTERARYGPACKHYLSESDDYSVDHEINTTKWERVNLPHDYIIEQRPDKNFNNTLGFFDYQNAWYRKKFYLSEESKDKRLYLLFEGIATWATVYLNGCLLKHNFCGYASFEVDITDYVEYDEENVLAVYVNTQEHEGWWYEGGGIYRHVWLISTEKISVDLWGVYVIPEKKDGKWKVGVENTIRNDLEVDKEAYIRTVIYEGENAILQMTGKALIHAKEKAVVTLYGTVDNPHLWDIDDPYQHRAVTYVSFDGSEKDSYEVKFGFREITIDPDKGLFLNGKHVFIKGVCAHQDFGLTGKAVPDNILKHKVKLIKEMGANGYRCSHYPHPEATMDALDELGFITMAETRWFDSSDYGLEQLEMLIKRDRNRPSVVFWSIGNEEPKHITESGRRICKSMISKIKQLDNTRFITAAVSYEPDNATVYDELDAIGINYNFDKYDIIRKKYPDKPIFSSECCALGTTRGWYYEDNHDKGYLNAIDKETNTWWTGREKTWLNLNERKWVFGCYQWIAFEHRGECVWPRLCSQSGAIDLFLQKKDAFYQNQSHWIDDKPILHILPHWNFKGLEGENIRTVAYTNCDEAEVFLNGKSQGRKSIQKYIRAEWQIEYEPGELIAVGYNNGEKVIEDVRITSGREYALKLKLENEISIANGMDIALVTCYCIDESGIEVPDATPTVDFTVNDFGRIVGTGSDVCDHNPVIFTERKMRAGRISVAVMVGEKAGNLKLYAQARGLEAAVLTIKLS